MTVSNPQDLTAALHALGISPTEQEVVDMQCEVEKKGRIFFPDFCKLCLRKFREFDEENFKQELFKVLFKSHIMVYFQSYRTSAFVLIRFYVAPSPIQ